MAGRVAAEGFPPGEFIRDELEERGWTQLDLAEVIDRSLTQVNAILTGKAGISAETAKRLGEAFDQSAEYWMNLETAYQLWRNSRIDDSVSRRARLYGRFPVREMVKRHWIESSSNVDVLETQLLRFFEIKTTDDTPVLCHAARKGTSYEEGPTTSQCAWLLRATRLARAVPITGSFSQERLTEAFDRLHLLTHSVAEVRHVPRILADAGVRFLVVEPLPQSRMDGACLWLDGKSPVVVLSLRLDRIDTFWFTLMHELAHVKNKDGMNDPSFDADLVGEQAEPSGEKPEVEKRADEAAAEALIPQRDLASFIARVRPLYSKVRIRQFAARMKVHEGIVLGQLQHRHEVPWQHNREMLERVRHIVTSSAVTDGWGSALSAAL